MRSQDAILISGASPSHQLERAQIGGEKAEAGDPRCHLTARKKVVLTGIRPPLQIETDGQHQSKIENNDNGVDGRQMYEVGGDKECGGQVHYGLPVCMNVTS